VAKFKDLTGQRFGWLIVVSRAENSKAGKARWNCICDCGETTTANGQSLRDGHTKSCGCLQRKTIGDAHLTHGMCGTPIHGIWKAMRQRCMNPSNHGYRNYGGRGISICERWNKFENFYADMGRIPAKMSLERRDNNGNYCPENCCWATRKSQNRNTRKNIIIKYQGKSQCMVAWAEELGVNYIVLWRRLQKNSPQFAFNM